MTDEMPDPDTRPELPAPDGAWPVRQWRRWRAYRAREKTSADLYARDTAIIAAFGALMMLLAAFAIYTYYRGRSDKADSDAKNRAVLQCVTDWSQASTNRLKLLTKLSDERNAAQYAKEQAEERFLLALARRDQSREVVAFERLVVADKAFLRTFAAYIDASKRNPPPPAPALLCPQIIKHSATRTSTTKTATTTATVSRPGTTTTAHGPPATTRTDTRVVTTPGATRTVTTPVTRTRTRTVTTTRAVPAPLPAVVCDHLPPPLRRQLC